MLDIEPRADVLASAIAGNARADYVYMYPPRQAYRPLAAGIMDRLVADSLGWNATASAPLNLYFHVPFCRQICAYCNLFAVAGDRAKEHEQYIATICHEFDHYAPGIQGRPIDTLYIGGGTPSLLKPRLLGELLEHVCATLDADPDQIPELALEVAPETLTLETAHQYVEAGINRVNLGVQSWDRTELLTIGRQDDTGINRSALEIALGAGFRNVCVDLIYGLPGQSMESWRKSLSVVVDYSPPTVCCYGLTLRPGTGFARRGVSSVDAAEQYARYDAAHSILTAAGYLQETNVRWVQAGVGGYRQKANHWAGQDIVGLGAGGRSYLRSVDTRNGYSVSRRTGALRSYYKCVSELGHGRSDAYVMTNDEAARKAVILGLGSLDRAKYAARFGDDPLDAFPAEFDALRELELIRADSSFISLTTSGQRHRDVIVQMFFSAAVKSLVAAHDYNE